MNKTNHPQNGFTLLEMLVALSVSALLITLAYSAVHIGIRSWDTSRERVDQVDELRIGWRFLHSTLAHTRPVLDPKARNQQVLFHGEPQSLKFTADMSSYLGLGGLYVIQLSIIEDDDKQQLKLERLLYAEYGKDDVTPQTQDAILADDLKQLNIQYYGHKDAQETSSWHSDWHTQDSIPTLIQIDIETAQLGHWPRLVAAPDLGQINTDTDTDTDEDGDSMLEDAE